MAFKFIVELTNSEASKLQLPEAVSQLIENLCKSIDMVSVHHEKKQWPVILEAEGKNYYLKRGWNAVVTRLGIGDDSLLLFEVESPHKWILSWFTHEHVDEYYLSFVRTLNPPIHKVLVMPARFFLRRFRTMLSKPLKVYMDEGYEWSVILEHKAGQWVLSKGWKQVIDQANLKKDQILIFDLLKGNHLLMSVFNPNGLQVKLPDIITLDDTEEDETDDDDHESESDSDSLDSDECDCVEEADDVESDNDISLPEKTFVVKKSPFCISIFIVRHAGWDETHKAKIKVNDLPSKIVKLVPHQNMVNHYKYYVDNWSRFIQRNGLELGDHCYVKFDKDGGFMHITKLSG